MDLTKLVAQQYGKQLRLRVCGLCFSADKLLLVQHRGLGPAGILWAPPGGGAHYGSDVADNLRREFWEESGLEVVVHDFLFLHEYLNPPLHAVELFFMVQARGGTLLKGTDPESPPEAQLIQDVSFLSWAEIKEKPADQLHQILQHSSSADDLKSKRGYYNFSH